ncbi:MAG: NAD/NADP octopine/nopaline dehydrogenase family protein [Candidatus Bathyarchaeia archaeon]
MEIAIVGAGAGGYACAAHLSSLGHNVALYDRKSENLEPIEKYGGIEVIGNSELKGLVKVKKLTMDIEEALESAEVILNPVPAIAHEYYAKACAPFVKDGQTIITLGKGGGALTYSKVFEELKVRKRIFLGEINTLAFGVTKLAPLGGLANQIRIEAPVNKFIVAAFPSKDTDRVHEIMKTLFPKQNPRKGANVMETILVDYNALTHPPPMICNIARIESGDHSFHLFGRDALTKAVVNIIEKLDRERMALSKALGIKAYPLEEEVYMVGWNPVYGQLAKGKEEKVLSLYEALHTEYLEVCEGPFNIRSRHLTEDIPYGLVTFASIGDMVKVPTPVTKALITIAESLLQEDFWKTGRTVERLGIDPSWSLEELKRFLMEGKV